MADGVCNPAATRRDLRKGVRKMRQRHGRVFSRFCVGLVLAVALLAVSAGSAGAKNTKPKHNTCTGTTDNFPTELGNLISRNALGVIVHGASIGGSVIQHHGGGGFTCEPQGVFALLGPPAYSAYEDSTIGGSIDLKGMRGCWLGVNRDQVHHSVRVF